MEINNIALLAALVAGLSTGVGALPIYLKKTFTQKSMDLGMGFSAGVMLVASFIALILPGIEKAKTVFASDLTSLAALLVSLVIGYVFIIVLHDFLPHEHLRKDNDMTHKRKISRVTLIILAICLHNFPEGLAVGVGFGSGEDASGVALALAISIQNMPEGLVVAFGLLSEGASKNRAFLMALLSGLVEPVAALFGFISTQLTTYALPVSMGFAGGAMLFVICQEMLPELFRDGNEKNASAGVVLGVVVMLIIDSVLSF